MKRKIKAGTTGVMEPIRIRDTSSSVGAGLGSLAYNTAGLTAKYRRKGDSSWTSITLVTATAGTFTSGGFCTAGSAPTGAYELHVPNAALAGGAEWCEVEIYGATNMLAVSLFYELDAFDYQAGTITTVTNLTNAPTAGDFTSTMKTSIATAVDASTAGGNVNSDTHGNAALKTIIDAGFTAAETDFDDVQARLPAALVGGRMASDLGSVGGDAGSASGLGTMGSEFSDNGYLVASMNLIRETPLTESATGRLAASFIGQHDVETPVFTNAQAFPANFGSLTIANNAVNANVLYWFGQAVPAPTAAGVPKVDAVRAAGDATAMTGLMLAGNNYASYGNFFASVMSYYHAAEGRTAMVNLDDTTPVNPQAVAGNVTSILSDTTTLLTEIAEVQAAQASQFTTPLVESYRADGATGSVAQLLYEIMQMQGDRSISGTTGTVKKIDGSATAFTQTFNDAVTPTAVTRS